MQQSIKVRMVKNFKCAMQILCNAFLILCYFSSAGIAQSTFEVTFNKERGFYNAPFVLIVNVDGYNPTASYTNDGSDPKSSFSKISLSSVTNNSISIDKTTVIRVIAIDGLDTIRTAHSYLFVDDIVNQNTINTIQELDYPAVWGTGVTNTIDPDAGNNGATYLTITQNANYEMNTEVVNNPAYAPKLEEGLKQIPTVSISTDKNNLFHPNTGIYNHTLESGDMWEVPVSIEMFNGDGTTEFQVEAGLKISGASTRKYDFYKHSFRMVFKEKYGDTKLRYPVYGPKGADEFNNLQLRMIGHCSPHDWDHRRRAKTQFHKDQWTRNIHRQMGNLSPRSKFVHLYLNGLYWGLYDLTERPDSDFLSTYLGGDKEDYDAVKILEIKDGDSIAYYKMFELLNNVEQDTFSNGWTQVLIPNQASLNTMYDSLVNYLDVNSFIDYFLVNALFVNTDWGANNWWAGRKREAGAGWKYFVWDAEFVLNDSPVYTSRIFQGSDRFHPNQLDKGLRPVKRYQRAFGDRVQCHCVEEDGALHTNNLLDTYLELGNSIDKASLLELARWGDVRGTLVDYNSDVVRETTKYVDEIIPDLFYGDKGLLFYLRYGDNNYYPKGISAPELSNLGGEVSVGYQLVINNPNIEGEVYYTLDGSDPLTPNNPAKRLYTTPITINDYVRVSARAYIDTFTYGIANRDTIFDHWSAMCPRDFYAVGYYDNIAINEIHYNPADVGNVKGSLLEFIELKNNGNTLVNLCNTFFNTGIEFNFPLNTFIQPNDFLVLARDTTGFNNNYNVKADGEFKGKLSNGGEEVVLNRPDGRLIDQVEYDDYSPWDTIPDGRGESLSLDFVNNPASLNNDSYSDWRRSVGGPTPRKENVFCAPITINEAIAEPSCYGFSDGFVHISVNGAGGPFTYTWSNGGTNAGIFNIPSGSYTVNITDSQNCPTFRTVTIEDPEPLISNLNTQPATSSTANNGAATVNLNSTFSSYSINWSNGMSSTASINNLLAGIHSVTVNNGAGCDQTQPFEIQIGSPCPIPTNIVASSAGDNSIILSWDTDSTAEECKVDFRKVGNATWNTMTTNNSSLALYNLDSCADYEYKISGVCQGGSISNTSLTKSVTTNCSQNNCDASNTNGYSHNSTPTSAFLVWDINPNSTYELFYRKASSAEWFSYETNFHFAILFDLDVCSDYEWYVEVTCPNNIVSTSNPNTFQTDCNRLAYPTTGQASDKQSITLYPNPVDNIINIRLPDNEVLDNAYLHIYHLNGKLIGKKKVDSYNPQYDVSNLAKGMYLLKFSNSSLSETMKIQVY